MPKLLFPTRVQGLYKLLRHIHHVERNMYLSLILTLFWATVLSRAETICDDDTPIVPTVDSCERALGHMEDFINKCGQRARFFGPTPVNDGLVSLPQSFIDPFSTVRPRCCITILWDPRPGFQPPAENYDTLKPIKLQQAAFRVRDDCVKLPRYGTLRRLGHEWIQPNQWVKVQFAAAFDNNQHLDTLEDVESGTMTMVLANGTNITVPSSMFNRHTYDSGLRLPIKSGNIPKPVGTA